MQGAGQSPAINDEGGNDMHHIDCLICGKPLVYQTKATPQVCAVCKQPHQSNAVCEDGHFVCDRCHAAESADFYRLLPNSTEKDPVALFMQIVSLPTVHMHGPEHHSIVPCVLLTAYRNNGGEIALDAALDTARQRGEKVPGGICGFWGVCGAAAGAGIYASVVTGSSPLDEKVWGIPPLLAARCLDAIAKLGGPRCCKRNARIAIETAVQFTKEHFHVSMPTGAEPCMHHSENKECLYRRCPYYQ